MKLCAITRFGPLVQQWTMRYEAKHNLFKRLAQNIGNFINISWTLAVRHQQWHCYHSLNTQTVGQEDPEIGPGMYIIIIAVYVVLYELICIYVGQTVMEFDRIPKHKVVQQLMD